MGKEVKKNIKENKRDVIEGTVFMVTLVIGLYVALDFGAKMGF
jgi:hypothetical protein